MRCDRLHIEYTFEGLHIDGCDICIVDTVVDCKYRITDREPVGVVSEAESFLFPFSLERIA